MAATANATTPLSCPRTSFAHDETLLCHWSSGPDTRGTFNILWLCLSTLGICVWTAVHPDVPDVTASKVQRFGRRIGWLFVGLFVPEALVLVALAQLRLARWLLLHVDEHTEVPTRFPWWMRYWKPPPHRTPQQKRDSITSSAKFQLFRTQQTAHNITLGSDRRNPWTLTHSYIAVMHGFIDNNGRCIRVGLKSDMDAFLPYLWRSYSDPRGIPDIAADDLADRSKQDILSKVLLCWQLFYFVVNCVARWDQTLPLSLFEITTIAHSLCSLVALALWIYKPHGIDQAIFIDSNSPPAQVPNQHHTSPSLIEMIKRALNKMTPSDQGDDGVISIAVVAIATLYGLPNLLGRSVHFTTATESLCWQIATFAVIGCPLGTCLIGLAFRVVRLKSDGHPKIGTLESIVGHVLILMVCLLLLLYVLSSMYLVGESLRQIVALPEGSFTEPDLTRYIRGFS